MREKSSELDKIKSHFASANLTFQENDRADIPRLVKFLSILQKFERPDCFAKINNNVLILEHFEFDSTETKKRGNKTRKEIDRLDKSFAKLALDFNKVTTRNDVAHCSQTIENYIKNSTESFIKHYKKIDEYKQNLIKENIADQNTKFLTGFFIEDKNILGSLYVTNKNDNPKRLLLFYCKEFLDLFSKSKKLDFVITTNEVNMQRDICLLTHKTIIDCRKYESLTSEMKILDLGANAQTIQFGFKISDSSSPPHSVPPALKLKIQRSTL